MAHTTTWEPMRGNGDGDLPDHVYAFPHTKRDPLLDAVHVRNALQHFGEIEAKPEEKELAFANLKRAADHFHVEVNGNSYDDMCCKPQCEIHPRD